MAQIFIESDIAYSSASVKNAVDAMKLSVPQMQSPARHLIGFRNGVFDFRRCSDQSHQHSQQYGVYPYGGFPAMP